MIDSVHRGMMQTAAAWTGGVEAIGDHRRQIRRPGGATTRAFREAEPERTTTSRFRYGSFHTKTKDLSEM